MKTIVIIGGGAAGFFAALAAKEQDPASKVILLEKTQTLLAKVRISGGGRCNVTHSCFEPKELVKNYPRGNKALLGPFTKFQPLDTIRWFEERGVKLKTESDGRMFPITDQSETIINCLMSEADKLKVDIRLKQRIKAIEKEQERFVIRFDDRELECDRILLASGSSHQGFDIARTFGHSIVDPVPSLFTFNIRDFSLVELAGISAKRATVRLKDSNEEQTGPLLITHWGFSGPAALKLSAWAARELHARDYKTDLLIDWLPDFSLDEIVATLRSSAAKCPFDLSKNLWARLMELCKADVEKKWKEQSNASLKHVANFLKNFSCRMDGKTTHKDEFVTCGGIELDEVNFKTMESKLCKGLHFAGEVLNIDGVTGGFNFQNAWTTGWLAGRAMVC